jgi:hypothetical protein
MRLEEQPCVAMDTASAGPETDRRVYCCSVALSVHDKHSIHIASFDWIPAHSHIATGVHR